jgi:hypothetical protein
MRSYLKNAYTFIVKRLGQMHCPSMLERGEKEFQRCTNLHACPHTDRAEILVQELKSRPYGQTEGGDLLAKMVALS